MTGGPHSAATASSFCAMRRHRLLCVVLLVAAPARSPAQSPDRAARIEQLCRPIVDAGLIPALAVGVFDRGTTATFGFGHLGDEATAAPDADTVFEIGSISKVFTGLLLADAVGRGTVALEDPVQKYLPADVVVPNDTGAPIRLVHLATHTSGLPRMPTDFTPRDQVDPYADYDSAALLHSLTQVQLASTPGRRYAYSNLGAGLLGWILVRASGAADYEHLLHERISAPLQLSATVLRLSSAQRVRLAAPHDLDGDPAHTWAFDAIAGAGGIRSTVRDLLHFAAAQVDPGDGPLAAAFRLSQQRHTALDVQSQVGLGWHFGADDTRWHNGQTGGYHSFLGIDPARQQAVCVLGNAPSDLPDRLGTELQKLLRGDAITPVPMPAAFAVDQAALLTYVGRYRLAARQVFAVTLDARGLRAQLADQPTFRLHPTAAHAFAYRQVEASVTFEVDADGKATALVLHQNGHDQRCPRDDT